MWKALLLVIFFCSVVAGQAVEHASILGESQSVIKEISAMRGLPIQKSVKFGFKSRKELESIIIEKLDENYEPAEMQVQEKLLRRLGLIPRDYDLRSEIIKLLTEQIGGFYEPRKGEFYLVDWLSLEEQKPVIAHELMHALQDQNFDLRRFEKAFEDNSDKEIAVQALIEGEATIVMFNYMFRASGTDITTVKLPLRALLEASGGMREELYPALARAPRALRESLEFPYFYGAEFVHKVVYNSSWKRIDESYRDLPDSTEQIIHPEKFLNREKPLKVQPRDVSAFLSRDWKKLETQVNGEFGLYLILAEFLDKERAQASAAGWGGDVYEFYEHKDGTTAFVMSSTWDTEEDAEEFFEAYCERTTKRYPTAKLVREQKGSRVYSSAEGDILIELAGRDVFVLEGVSLSNQEEPSKSCN
ncbi:MAG: hypothetical protein RMM17_09160 [Acidobacteriota bacterium]|nr:hypothetical protein [Blastocatellia bacterium]MDW8412836.1 hypothetical protein [Acidobacteriota bacterium]